jgi:hypothetical protein
MPAPHPQFPQASVDDPGCNLWAPSGRGVDPRPRSVDDALGRSRDRLGTTGGRAVDGPRTTWKHIGVVRAPVDRVQHHPQAVHPAVRTADLREHPVTPSLHRAYYDHEIHGENLVFHQRCGRTVRSAHPPLDAIGPGPTGDAP